MYVTSPIRHRANEINFIEDMNESAFEVSYQNLSVGTGNHVFFEGDDADYIYEVISGVVRSSKVLIDGRRQVLSFGYPGDMVGLSHDQTYHCDCDAIADVKLRVVHKNAFKKGMEQDPELCINLLRKAAAEVNSMQEHFIMLGRKTALEKMASFLIAVMDRKYEKKDEKRCFDLPMSRADIADFLGLTIETVSRNLTKLRKLGVISLPNAHRVCVSEPTILRELAEAENLI